MTLPPVLILQVTLPCRYQFLGGSRGQRPAHVEFPDVLDLTRYFLPSQQAAEPQSPIMYHLKAVVRHIDLGKLGGHFIACIRIGERDYSFDDRAVAYSDCHQDYDSTQARLLIYERR
jgi:ubiquitin C-terminal hydrolase